MHPTANQMDPQHLRAIVDMGSNGIRFSISSLAPPTARIMPCLYQDRAAISLYDAQYDASGTRQAIPGGTIHAVQGAMKEFKRVTEDFGVPASNVHILATEATRTALNSEAFRDAIHEATGWTVDMLAKEDEGRIGAMGIASSLESVHGIVMDLGGGSTQIAWMMVRKGEITTSPIGSVSMPYGAAALSRRLEEAERQGGQARNQLREEIMNSYKHAWTMLNGTDALREQGIDVTRGTTLYLSGGGFRGWGYAVMSGYLDGQYPIPIINGFEVPHHTFSNTQHVTAAVADAENPHKPMLGGLLSKDSKKKGSHEDFEHDFEQPQSRNGSIFRISKRRAGQVPAVAFLINAMTDALPVKITDVQFCQGGVREGALFNALPPSIRAEHPLVVAAAPHARSSQADIQTFAQHLISALPTNSGFDPAIIQATAYMLFAHVAWPREARAAAALRCTTTGSLAATHGLSHHSRATLCLILCERWGGYGNLPPLDFQYYTRMQRVVDALTLWFCRYLGRVAALLGSIYPAGRCQTSDNIQRLLGFHATELKTTKIEVGGKKDKKEKKEKKDKKGHVTAIHGQKDKHGDEEKTHDHGRTLDETVEHAFTLTVEYGLRTVQDATAPEREAILQMRKRKKNWLDATPGHGVRVNVQSLLHEAGERG